MIFSIVFVLVFIVFVLFQPSLLLLKTPIHGDNLHLYYDGLVINGGAFKHLNDECKLDWKLRNYDEYIIDNWLVWAKIRMPNGDYKIATTYGSGQIPFDEEVYITSDLGGLFDVEGNWLMRAVTFEGDLLSATGEIIDTDVVIDRIDDEDIYVAYNLALDKQSSVSPDEITSGDAVTFTYSAINVGDARIGLCIEAFADKNLNHVRDVGETKFVDVYKDPCNVNDGLNGLVLKPVTTSDTFDGINASICFHFIAYDIDGTVVNPDLHIYDDYIVTVTPNYPDVSISVEDYITTFFENIFRVFLSFLYF